MAMQWSRFNRNIKQSLVKMAESKRSRVNVADVAHVAEPEPCKENEPSNVVKLEFTPRLRVKGVNDLTKINKIIKPE